MDIEKFVNQMRSIPNFREIGQEYNKWVKLNQNNLILFRGEWVRAKSMFFHDWLRWLSDNAENLKGAPMGNDVPIEVETPEYEILN